MTQRSVTHGTFVIERVYDAAPARVFAAWADPVAKTRWFNGTAGTPMDLDFTEGGVERTSGGKEGGPVFTYEARFQDIVSGERIVSTNQMHADGTRISVNLVTVQFLPEGEGTRLILTDQGTYLDGHDNPEWRESGTRTQLDALATELGSPIST
ncbi:SRPBCC family protein [Streptomyces sp. NPDC008163]|uniref:SRPBCC family protein n=1 Tax=Streptomyces sp. NPDC008163 TaxID=3364818 RepID=UPI0036F16CFE